MKHLYSAATILEDEGFGETGVNIFINTMPHDVKTGIQLQDPVIGADIDDEQEGFTRHTFQIIVHDIDPQAAWDRAYAMSNALRVFERADDGIHIKQMYPLRLPSTYPQGDSDKMETSVLMRVWFKIT